MSVRNLAKNKWQIDYYPRGRKGKRERVTFTGTEGDARQLEMELRRQNAGTLSVNPKISDILPEYLEWLKAHRSPATYKDIIFCLKKLEAHFGRYPVSRITLGLINSYKVFREGRNRSINKELAYLQSIIGYMVKNNYANPLPFKIEKVPYKRPLPQIPAPLDVEKFLAALKGDHKKAMALLMYQTGLRWKEVRLLKWENIDWQEDVIYLVDTKGSEPRTCYLTQKIKDLLLKFKADTGWVFVNPKTQEPYKNIRKSFRLASERAGIKKVRPHLLRHAFGTYALEATRDLRLVQELLGHKSIRMTELYTQISKHRKKDGTRKTVEYVKNIVSKKE